MVRIAITAEAFDAICATLPLGSVAYEAEANERGERNVWLEDAMADRRGAMRGPGESYSDVILRAAIIAAVFVILSGPALAAAVKSQQAVASEHGIRAASSAPAASGGASSSAYIGEVSAALRSHMFYPRAARGARGVVFVAFTIGASGALSSFAITRSSGDNDLDAAARTLVQSIRFPPPPGAWVHITTSFIYAPR